MSNIVKYNNKMNRVSFAGFNDKELNIFFSLCQQMKETGMRVATFSFEELRKLSGYKNRSIDRFYDELDKVYKKMIQLNLKYEDDEKLIRFVLFNRYEIDKKLQTVTIKTSEDFEYILNNLVGNFTLFELQEFVSLSSLYSKNLFKLLKQWESIKEIKFEIEEFKYLLTIPKTYRSSEIDKKVLCPIMKELPKYFYNLKFEKIKEGRKITHIKFTWQAQPTVSLKSQQENMIDCYKEKTPKEIKAEKEKRKEFDLFAEKFNNTAMKNYEFEMSNGIYQINKKNINFENIDYNQSVYDFLKEYNNIIIK